MPIEIKDINDSRINQYRNLKTPKGDKQNLILETIKVIKHAITSKQSFNEIFIVEESYFENKSIIDQIVKPENIYIADKGLMQKIVGHNLHHGEFASISMPKFKSLDDLEGPLVVLNGIEKLDNLGVIARNCAAFGIKNLLVDSKTCPVFNRRVTRVSTGHIFKLNVFRTDNLEQDLIKLKEKGFNVYGTSVQGNTHPLPSFKLQKPMVLIIGNEGNGVDQCILDVCHENLYIPMQDDVNSLNASSSTAVLLYHYLNFS